MNPKKKNKSSLKKIPESRAKLYRNDPVFIKKHEQAQKNIDKYGIPEELLEIQKKSL